MGAHVSCPHCQSSLAVPRGEFAPGTRIGGFEIVRPLGKGGMGEVYLARQLAMGREVALKVLSAEFAAKADARDRFLKEVRVAAKLEHPHIVTAYDAGEDEGLCYMAMSFVAGASLAARLKPGAVMGEREALKMVRKLAQALDHAWNRFRIIHRDIKPANILFDADGEPKLADMGLSKSLDDAEAMTMSGEVMGTPNYMSPEQAEGAEGLDLRADIYSLGATLYHALTGQMPFGGSSIMAVLRKQAVEILPDPREFNPELSEHCVGLLQIMLAKKREDRYAEWKALIKDIDGVLDFRPPSISLPGEGGSVLIRRGTGHAPHHKKIVIPKGGLHHEMPAAAAPPPQKKREMQPRDQALIFGGIAALAIAGLAVGLGIHLSKQRGEERRLQADREARQAAEARERESRAAVEKTQAEVWQVAADYAKANPGEFDRALTNFEEAGKRLAGTKYELMAKNEADRLRAARQAAVEKAFGELEARAREMAGRKDFGGAADVFAKYGGPFAADLAVRRAAAEQGHREAALAELEKLSQAEREAKEREREVIAAAAEAVYAGDAGTARKSCQAFLDDLAVTIDKSVVKRIAGWLEAAAGADRVLLATFEAQKGKEVVLVSGAAKVPVRVLGVRGDRIQIEQRKGVGWASAEMTLAQIPFEERQARMAAKLGPEALGLWNGMAYLRARRPDLAAEAFKSTGELATLLLAKTEGAKAGERETAAGAAFAQALQAAGLRADEADAGRLAERLAPGRVTTAQAASALRQLDAYAAAFGDTQHAKTAAELIAALRPALEAAQKGAAPPAPAVSAPKTDDFAKRVLAARAYTGEVIRCSPQGGDGIFSIKEAVTKLKRGMILHLLPGTYKDENLSVSASDIVVEGEPTGLHGAIRLNVRSGMFRSLSGIGLILGGSEQTGEEYAIVDSKLLNVGLWANTIRCFNSWIMNAYISGQGDVELRHCTVFRGSQSGPARLLFGGPLENIRICDSVLWDMDRAVIARKEGNSQTRLRVERCLVGNPSAVAAGQPPRLSTDLSDFPGASMRDCVIETPVFVSTKVARLTSDSRGHGIADGGRDPGALLDEQGNILPLDPVAPAGAAARIGVQAQPGVAPSQATPSPSGGGGTWISLNLHPGFNADFISTGTRVAADSFSVTATSNSTWGTTNYARRYLGVEGPGLPDDGRVAIARDPPDGFFELETAASANAILITAPEGRQPKPVRIELPIVQQQRYAKIAVLHGGAWGDGEVILTVEYGGGAPSRHVLAIRDWKLKGPRLPLPTNAWSAAQVLGSSGRAEMFGQVFELDTTRVIRALRFDFDAYHPPKDYASTSRTYGAAVFAVSALPAGGSSSPAREAAPARGGYGTNVVVNGDFERIEKGKAAKWIDMKLGTIPVREGSNTFMRMDKKTAEDGTPVSQCLRQIIPMPESANSVMVSAKFRTEGPNTGAKPAIMVSLYDEGEERIYMLYVEYKDKKKAWDVVEKEGKVPPGSRTANVQIVNGSYAYPVDMDDVEVRFK